MVSKKEVSAYNLCDLQELQSCTAKFFQQIFSATAFRALRFGLPAGTCFAMRNGERLHAGRGDQVFCFLMLMMASWMLNIPAESEILVTSKRIFYRSRGISTCECALDAASSNDTAPARASGPSSCAASGKWINCSMSSG